MAKNSKAEFTVYSTDGNRVARLTVDELHKVKPNLKPKPIIDSDRLSEIKQELQNLEKGELIPVPMRNTGIVLEVRMNWESDSTVDWVIKKVVIINQEVASKFLLRLSKSLQSFYDLTYGCVEKSKELKAFQKRIIKFEKSLTKEECEAIF